MIYVILYALNIFALITAMLVLIHYTCRLQIKYSPIKVLIRALFFFDFWYLHWFMRWLYRNPFAILSTVVIFCLFGLIIQMGGLLSQSNVFERSTWMLIASPIAWIGMAIILQILPKVFPKIGT